MDTIESWIWEHATKYGMTKVLKKIKCSFSQVNMPNSWLSALYLQEIKHEWSKQESKITPEVLNALRKCLTSTFKHYRKDLKHVMRTVDCIQLELYCKAAFLVIRSTSCTSAVKLQAREALFPCWNISVWSTTKHSYCLKDDHFMEEIKIFYSELRSKLCQLHHEKEILDAFGKMMEKYFPSLISFMRKIKPSRLERIQKNKFKLDKQFGFLRDRLSNGFLNELVILDLLEDVQRKKITKKALKFWNQSKQVEATVETSIEATLYVLPPDPKFVSNDNQFYPSCFLANPFMPTHIVLENGGQFEAILINRNVPRKPNGEDFGTHWFADTRLPVIKVEKNDVLVNSDCKKVADSASKIFNIAHSVAQNSQCSIKASLYGDNGLQKEEILVSNTSDEEPSRCTTPRDNIRSLVSYNLLCGSERVNSVQSWVDNSLPHSPSSIENDDGAWGLDGTPPLEEVPSNYQTSIQRVDSNLSEKIDLETTGIRTGFKRKLYDDAELAEDIPKSKRIPVDEASDGRNILPNVVETLKQHSQKLRINDPCFAKHCEKLDLCIQRVSLSHQKLLEKVSADHSATCAIRQTFSLTE